MVTFDQLPLDLVAEILSRLPVKSLVRLVSVCKTWSCLIKHPEFMQLHLSHANKNSPRKLLLRSDSVRHYNYYRVVSESERGGLVVEEFFLPKEPKYDGLTSSCNGLVCLYQSRGTLVSLFNPAMRKVKDLPSSPNASRCSGIEAIVGFGLDRKAKDMKVVRIILEGSRKDVALFEVYSLASNTWREIHPTIDLSPMKDLWPSWIPDGPETNLADGVYYWLITSPGHEKQAILSFDFSDEVFEMIPLPPVSLVYTETIGSFQGCMSVISRQHCGPDRSIWISGYNKSKKEGEEGRWCTRKSSTGFYFPPRLIGFWNDKIVSQISSVLFLTDPHTTEFDVVFDGPLKLYRSTEYVESLLLFE